MSSIEPRYNNLLLLDNNFFAYFPFTQISVFYRQTGLTPLMEAASGGYVDVGRVLLEKGADVNAPPVPSSRDTALTIASDKGHVKFVELLINKYVFVKYSYKIFKRVSS